VIETDVSYSSSLQKNNKNKTRQKTGKNKKEEF